MELPSLNKRISELVDYFSGGTKSQFCKKLNGISQQRFNRIFIADPRTGKIPAVPDNILTEIIQTYNTVNAEWLLTGKGEMLKNISENSETLNIQTPQVPEIDKNETEIIPSLLSIIKNQGETLKNAISHKEEKYIEQQIKIIEEIETLKNILESRTKEFEILLRKLDQYMFHDKDNSEQKKVI